eukprot:364426-Chlamydomonas_euryale.AAC.7
MSAPDSQAQLAIAQGHAQWYSVPSQEESAGAFPQDELFTVRQCCFVLPTSRVLLATGKDDARAPLLYTTKKLLPPRYAAWAQPVTGSNTAVSKDVWASAVCAAVVCLSKRQPSPQHAGHANRRSRCDDPWQPRRHIRHVCNVALWRHLQRGGAYGLQHQGATDACLPCVSSSSAL